MNPSDDSLKDLHPKDLVPESKLLQTMPLYQAIMNRFADISMPLDWFKTPARIRQQFYFKEAILFVRHLDKKQASVQVFGKKKA